MDPYVTLITTLASAALGGAVALVGVFLTNRGNTNRLLAQLDHDNRKKKEELLRDRGEELYELVDKWINGILGHYLSRMSVMREKISYNESLDIDAKQLQGKGINFGRIEMLIDVYFPQMRAQYDVVISRRTKANQYVAEHKFAYERGNTDGTKFLKPFTAAQVEMEAAADELKSLIVEQVRAV